MNQHLFPGNTEKQWESWGEQDPYFGVLTSRIYHRDCLTDDSLEQFFASGRDHVDSLLQEIRIRIDPEFEPKMGLDFGCGVGRVLVPLAQVCETVVGVDISPAMLAEAEKNCGSNHLGNVRLILSDDDLFGVEGEFDFIHSFLVFQHIRPERGLKLVRKLVGLLAEGGVGALQFHYFTGPTSILSRMADWAYDHIPFTFGVRNILKGEPFKTPRMQMNLYDLNAITAILQEAGCNRVGLKFNRKRDHYGVMFLFRK